MAVVLDFDNGTDGVAVPSGGVIESTTGPTYSSAAKHGALAMQCTGNTQQIRVPFVTTIEHSGSIYVRLLSLPDSRLRPVTIAAPLNSIVCAIGIRASGTFDLSDTVLRAESTVTCVPAQWHRLDWQFVESTKTLTARIFLDAESTVHDEQISHAFSASAFVPAKWNIGGISSGTGTTVHIDTFQAVSGLTWIGPVAPPSAIWTLWDGTQEIPLTLEGVWDGSTVQSASFDQITS
jgi:hypothetical protein